MKTKQIVLLSCLIALSIIGGYVKIFGSIALDLAPAILGTILLNPLLGAILAFMGHIISAIIAGFPLSFIVHLIIGVMMALTMFIFGNIRQLGKKKKSIIILSDIIAFIFNVFIAQIPLIPILGLPTLAALTPPLILGSIVNIVVAELVYVALPENTVMRIEI
ncbi:ECF transporter S component [Fundicoccus culcitae]|uniref:ECF transporter S component n=1 Tax=Fundicoccus culcitae TaxID=2969821 RepID=A0ABY5P3N0_9LACT|nr:ECF transporter S component [Fundicoccus culcitae]UUX33338.1 ECF transporter S component [Fundicoccus culcitae]